MPWRTALGLALALATSSLASPHASAAVSDEALGFERTPPRLAYMDGAVSFLRDGAEGWTPARVNIALASGDALYTAEASNLELQVGPRAYVRAGEQTDLGLTSLEPDFLQLRITSGTLSLDLRSLKAGQTLEVDTPHAAFTVERTGYYRIGVTPDVTTFTSRRGGRALVTPASGESAAIAPSEMVVVRNGDAPSVETYAAPELDPWDRWNYARTDEQIDAVSARYLPADVYGADDLDQYGDWRMVPTYGAIWVPRGVAVGWVPYSTGRWMYDPYYTWTWVDDAPWGWAPYHYGRWVYVSGFWGWCPGPLVVRAYYAPALVAFYAGGGFSIGIRFGVGTLGWVALGWGEPLVPWWGPTHFRGHPHWAGWGGPRDHHWDDYDHDRHERYAYHNAGVKNAIVSVKRDQFGRRDERVKFGRSQSKDLKPLAGDWSVAPHRSSLVADAGRSPSPPPDSERRSVVARRAPRADATPPLESKGSRRAAPQGEAPGAGAATARPPTRVAPQARPDTAEPSAATRRPPFGREGESVRSTPAPPPRYQETGRARRDEARQAPTAAPPAPGDRRDQGAAAGRSDTARRQPASAAPRELPGEPANRVYPQRERQSSPRSEPQVGPRSAPQQAPRGSGHSGGGEQGGRSAAPEDHGSRGGPKR